ncbi:hypothetical protein GBA52_022678 [Prunus armeniaca]|nr:hypothetical protein GBA52_022678 [Prunus armeniaca]
MAWKEANILSHSGLSGRSDLKAFALSSLGEGCLPACKRPKPTLSNKGIAANTSRLQKIL